MAVPMHLFRDVMHFSLIDHTNILEEPAASVFKVPHTLKAEATSYSKILVTNHQIMSCSERQSSRKIKVKKVKLFLKQAMEAIWLWDVKAPIFSRHSAHRWQ
jgi:hypothetical protein